jgi:hypothetical protein
MKKFNLEALTLAVAGVLESKSAFAGTEACFEVYKSGATGIDQTPIAWADLYEAAKCVEDDVRVAGTSTDLEPINEIGIAYELTGDLAVEFDDIDNTGDIVTGKDQYIVYIPTSDIPAGTNLKMVLSGAKWAGNSDQIHLVKYDEVAGDGSFVAVASSDGDVDGENEITFLTKAGTTIGAGTRLVFSRISVGGGEADLVSVGIKLENDACTDTDSSQSVTLAATSAVTDGGTGYNIIGGVSTAQSIADVSAQFWAFQGGSTAEVNVNAESSNDQGTAIVARTEFVYDSQDPGNQLVAKQTEAVFKTAFYDREATLDLAVTMGTDDEVLT